MRSFISHNSDIVPTKYRLALGFGEVPRVPKGVPKVLAWAGTNPK